MSERVYATPQPDRMVRDPLDNQPLPEEGKWVETGRYWRRREKAGDVKLTKSAPRRSTSEAVAPSKSAKKED